VNAKACADPASSASSLRCSRLVSSIKAAGSSWTWYQSGTERCRRQAEYVLAWASETIHRPGHHHHPGRRARSPVSQGSALRGRKAHDERLGIAKLDRVILAGAFGSHIDKVASLTAGNVPRTAPSTWSMPWGTPQATGSRMAAPEPGKRIEANETGPVGRVRRDSQTDRPSRRSFMQAMHIPHMKDKFPNLKELLSKQGSTAEIKG